jgi:hypothetical protein
MPLPQKLPLELMQTAWAKEIDPVIANTLIKGGLLITDINIKTGVNVINHLLNRKQQGYIITDINDSALLYRSKPFNNKTLTITSDKNCIISLWVF